MKRHWLNRTANALLAVTIIGIAYLAAASYGTANASAQNSYSFQETPFNLDAVESHARLQALPPPSMNPYDGTGNPTVVVTHAYHGGGLNGVLHRAEVWTRDAGGLDLCGERFILDDFTIFYPAGGASEADGNVTYVSNSNDPSGEECNLRVSPGKTWHYRVCIEYDGILDAPRPGVFDDWDDCLEDSVGSFGGPRILPSWEVT